MTDKIKNIPQQKLKAFSIGAMGKRNLSKRELEEQRQKEDDKAAAHAFQQFVETFQEVPCNGSSKVWVKAGTYDAGARKEDTREKGKLYKPTSRIASNNDNNTTSAEQAQAYAKFLINDRKPDRLGKKKASNKSNLESFKEELRQIQEEREERHKYKGIISKNPVESELDVFMKSGDMGSFDNGDPTTTNLYLGNLNPKITEQQLMEVFGRYGPLASIKIMWPRSDEEKSRGRNCGFVAYMSRKDGERALRNLNGKDVLGYEMKLGWGKSVVIPTTPIYIPPSLLELSLPPPPSGLPFNAQPQSRDKDILPKSQDELQEILKRSIIKVVAPNDRNLLMLIHRMVEFVVREGPMFEAMIMNREMHNPLFRFLFENQSPPHIYYRWKIYSIMHGDSQKEWTVEEFRMFRDGSVWKPPLMNNYSIGMPDELIVEEDERHSTKGSLSNTQRDRLEDLIRNLTPEARKIGEAMVFCIEHSDAADEVADCIVESLTNETTVCLKKIARLYLVSDILHNCAVKVTKASYYRRAFETRLLAVMKCLKVTYDNLDGRLKADGLQLRILRTMKAWEDTIYPKHYMDRLRNAFNGVKEEEVDEKSDNIDGDPLQDQRETDDDAPMDGAALLKTAMKQNQQQRSPSPGVDDYDGEVIPDNPSVDTKPVILSGFIKSKWETVDPEHLEAHAMTTSKWDLLEHSADTSLDGIQIDDSSENSDSRTMTEERRTKLREIEVKAVQYQDELESGQRSVRIGWTLPQQVEHYRRKLLRKADREKATAAAAAVALTTGTSEKEKDVTTTAAATTTTTPKAGKHKRDYDGDRVEDASDDETAAYYKDITSRKHKKHARSSSSGSASKHRSKSRSPSSTRNRKSVRAPSPPTPPRIRKHSPHTSSKSSASSSSGRHRRSGAVAAAVVVTPSPPKYSPPPPPTLTSRSSTRSGGGRHSPYSPRTSSTKSPPVSRASRRSSPVEQSSSSASSSSSRKHKHKHKL